MALTGALVAAGLVVGPAAEAEVAPMQPIVSASEGDPAVTDAVIREALAEARRAGAVVEERAGADGTEVVVIEGEDGAVLELGVPDSGSRLAAGPDKYGMYVAFNAFDQNLIISGAMTAIAASMCALGPAVCAVANVAAVLASSAIGSGGGIRCGTKSLRVYPVSHRAPRCA
ncbi:hypothetical protein DEI95_04895 [Curtobacterium sp. MCBD17_008]|nr:hypothetical protein DEI95_04895 [Curtobacterium sp. MCBD17_008]